MYVCQEQESPHDVYFLHSDDHGVYRAKYTAEAYMEAGAQLRNRVVKFNVDEILHDVNMNADIVSYRVVNVRRRDYDTPRYDVRNLETGGECSFYGSDTTIFKTLLEAHHYSMKVDMEYDFRQQRVQTPPLYYDCQTPEEPSDFPLTPTHLSDQDPDADPLLSFEMPVVASPSDPPAEDSSAYVWIPANAPESPPKTATRKRKARRELRMLLREQPRITRACRK